MELTTVRSLFVVLRETEKENITINVSIFVNYSRLNFGPWENIVYVCVLLLFILKYKFKQLKNLIQKRNYLTLLVNYFFSKLTCANIIEIIY